MDTAFWAKAHGAFTHFPFALTVCSAAFDAVGFALTRRPIVRDLHAAGYWLIVVGAAASVPAVFSGLLMTKGSMLGHGALRLHHLFVWPAFALVVALATWRLLVGRRATRRMLVGYLIVVGAAAGLMVAVGYTGGEMMIALK